MTDSQRNAHAPQGRIALARQAMVQPPRWARDLVLGEHCDGELYLPCVSRLHRHPEPLWWCRRYSGRNPLHWPYKAMTWLTGWVVMLDDC